MGTIPNQRMEGDSLGLTEQEWADIYEEITTCRFCGVRGETNAMNTCDQCDIYIDDEWEDE